MIGDVMRKVMFVLAGLVTVLFGLSTPAHAEDTSVPVKSDCNNGWYVNPDEVSLMPTQATTGLVFDGPSLVHHSMPLTSLADVATDGSFTTVGSVTGVKPLFKFETWTNYSTINKTPDGKWWSSKIATGDGSQGSPVATPGDLVGKWIGYTADTKVFSFGVGYANDTGNKATVSGVTFNQHVYTMACASPSTSSSSPVPTPTASVSNAPTLPVTGSNPGFYAGGAAALLVAGGTLFLVARRRRIRFEA